MPRRSGVPKRDVLPDPIYKSKVVTKLVNQIMQDGKKGTAQAIVYDAFAILKEKTSLEPVDVFNQAMANVARTGRRVQSSHGKRKAAARG